VDQTVCPLSGGTRCHREPRRQARTLRWIRPFVPSSGGQAAAEKPRRTGASHRRWLCRQPGGHLHFETRPTRRRRGTQPPTAKPQPDPDPIACAILDPSTTGRVIATLTLNGVTATRKGAPVLRGIDLSVDDGELVAIIGPSGSGKTTLLHVVAGLVPAEGRIQIGGVDVTALSPAERNVAMVFQENVLYPFRNVERNVGFPLEVQRRPEAEISERVHAEGRALHLESLMKRDPQELSAGHQQLVQVARALVRAPSIFLMDEPLSRLDAHLKVEMRTELRRMQRGYGVTTLYVTNDPTEAMALGDRLVVLADGRVAQTGTPEDVYHRPHSLQVAELTGDLSTARFEVSSESTGFWLRRGSHQIRAWAPALTTAVGESVTVGFRPEQLGFAAEGLEATIERTMHHGSHVITLCAVDGEVLAVRTAEPFGADGDRVHIAALGGHVFDRSGVAIASW
jgi:sn-glycerol 3-phosphate transport system ATP-binding protein